MVITTTTKKIKRKTFKHCFLNNRNQTGKKF